MEGVPVTIFLLVTELFDDGEGSTREKFWATHSQSIKQQKGYSPTPHSKKKLYYYYVLVASNVILASPAQV